MPRSESADYEIQPISGHLGLFDLVVNSFPGAGGAIELAFDRNGTLDEAGRARMDRAPDGSWRGRFLCGSGPTVVFWLRAIGNDVWVGPLDADCSVGQAHQPPPWAMGAVWYQVFPERFANGNTANDPSGPEVFQRAWNSSWSAVSEAEMEAAAARAGAMPERFRFDPDREGGALYELVTARRYGGDLEGLEARLGELEELGITALYLNPVFDAPSMHKYDAADYRHIDPTLAGGDPNERPAGQTLDPASWGWTGADRYFIDRLLPSVRRRGMRIVLDGVWNHTSTRFWAFRDMAERGSESPFSGWYEASFEAGRLIGWRGWPNRPNGGLPQFARAVDGNIVEPVRAHIVDVTRRWLDPDGDGDPSDGIDGWRLDVAPDIPTAFWREWCPLVRSINPGAVMLGETWFVDRERVGGGLFDAQMNYPFAMAVLRWLDGRPGFGAKQLREALDATLRGPTIDLAQMNLLGSHDTARFATMLNNPGRGYGGKEKVGSGAEGYRTGRPSQEAYELLVLATALQVAWPGSPLIYAGDEWGAFGADDPDNRKPVPWPDLGPFDNPEEAPDPALRARIGDWLRLRTDPEIGPVLRYGSAQWIESENPDLMALKRRLNATEVLFIFNRARHPIQIQEVGVAEEAWLGGCSARWWVRHWK